MLQNQQEATERRRTDCDFCAERTAGAGLAYAAGVAS